jgi:hypothetical protein
MHVGEVQIEGGGTEALMADNLLNGGQRDAFLECRRWRTSALSTRGVTSWERWARSATRLAIFCTGRRPMNQRSFRAKYEIIREVAEIRIETEAALAA